RLAVGEAVGSLAPFDSGMMAISSDGSYLFLSTPTGVREFSLPSATRATQFLVSDYPSPVSPGTTATLTVPPLNAFGMPTTGYTGTIHFTSSDPNAGLPGDYTFAPGNQGSQRFPVTLNTVGMQSISVVEPMSGATGKQSGIGVGQSGVAGRFALEV